MENYSDILVIEGISFEKRPKLIEFMFNNNIPFRFGLAKHEVEKLLSDIEDEEWESSYNSSDD